MIINLNNTTSYLEFELADIEHEVALNKGLRVHTGVKEPGYQKTARYLQGTWDGITEFYDKENHSFPTGLYPQVMQFLQTYQSDVYPELKISVKDNRPEEFIAEEDIPDSMTFQKEEKELTLFDHQYNAVKSALVAHTGIASLSTNSGKTASAVAYIKNLLPYMKYDEHIMYLVPSAVIFTQAINTMIENFGEENVGYIGDGQRKIKKINVIINASLVAGLKVPDPKAVKGKKERVQQIMAREILPNFATDTNLRYRLGMFLQRYPSGKRKDANKLAVKEQLQYIYDSCGTDAQVRLALNAEQAKYTKTLRTMFSKKQKKYEELQELIEHTPVVIADEAHHISGDGLYNALMTFDNAQYKLALTGSIDRSNKLLVQRITAFFGDIVYTTSNADMISQGVSAKPTVNMFNIPYEKPSNTPKSQFAFAQETYLEMYTREIVNNAKRNALIVNIAKGVYDSGSTTLIIVNQIAHGDILKDMFDSVNITAEFLSGADDSDTRKEITSRVVNGELRVLIATTIFDEGADISNLNALIIASGGKSFRQVMQRVGRVLRKKKTGENVASVFDFVDRQDPILYKHSKNRKSIYTAEGYELNVIG